MKLCHIRKSLMHEFIDCSGNGGLANDDYCIQREKGGSKTTNLAYIICEQPLKMKRHLKMK